MRARLLAALALVAVAASFLAFQPLRSPWWSGHDFDSVYVGTGLTLFRGERSNYYEHPGAPLQEGLGAIFTVAWLVSGDGGRAEKAEWWLSDLDRTRPYLRAFGGLLYVVSGLIAFTAIAWLTRSGWWGFLGGLLFLASPDLIRWAAVVKPDPLLAALGVACVALLVQAFRRRSGPLYVSAALVFGYALSVKVHAIALVVPFVLALGLRPPMRGWWTEFRADARAWMRAHRRLVGLCGAAWLAAVVALNALSAPPDPKPLWELAAGTVALAALAALLWRALRRTRFAAVVSVSIASVFALLAGMVLPNLFYASFPAPMVREELITLAGGGANVGAHPAANVWSTLDSWHVLLLVAAVGLVSALRVREWEALLWVSAAFAFGLLAYLRYGEVHYYATTVALAAPLVVRAFQSIAFWRPAIAALICAAALYQPYKAEILQARERGAQAARTERVNEWVAARLPSQAVAITSLEASDARNFYVVHFYTQWAPVRRYRFLPMDERSAEYIRSHRLNVAFVILAGETNASAVLQSLGLPGRADRVGEAPGFVYRVSSA